MSKLLRKITTSLHYRNIFKENRSSIDEFMNLLADQKSKDTLKGIINAYTSVCKPSSYHFLKIANEKCNCHQFFTSDGFEVKGTENPYFLPELFSLDRNMVYLDGGAYIGDTVQLLCEKLGGPCKRLYAFEPNDENFKKLLNSTEKLGNLINCVNAGLDDHDGIATFLKADAGSRVSEEGTETIHVIDTKRFLAELSGDYPTFVKLDIEGKESEVIAAMSEFIKQYHPDLAISVYHKLEDLWEIPLQIHRINPDYKIYLRHQSNYFTETVCYATKG